MIKTHWHIFTDYQMGKPHYPSKDAVYIYKTACAKELLSVYSDEFLLTSNQDKLYTVNCYPCRAWATAYFRQNDNVNGQHIYNRHHNEPKESK